jgi:hypothetical protein
MVGDTVDDMVPGPPADDRGATYEIRLACAPPESLRRRFPSMHVQAMRAQTVLFRRPAAPADLDELLDQLRSLGLPLTEIHQAPAQPLLSAASTADDPTADDPAGPAMRSYEVRVEGALGDTLRRYLRWSSCVLDEQKSARIHATPAELQRFLSACAQHGVGIEYVHRLHAVPAPSRDRARDHDVLRRPGG